MTTVADAILQLCPNASFIVGNESVNEIIWRSSDVTQPTSSEITAKLNELKAAEPLRLLREKRNQLLAETDWWSSSDLTMTAEQTAYRQSLRDITNTYTSLDDVVWPEKP